MGLSDQALQKSQERGTQRKQELRECDQITSFVSNTRDDIFKGEVIMLLSAVTSRRLKVPGQFSTKDQP